LVWRRKRPESHLESESGNKMECTGNSGLPCSARKIIISGPSFGARESGPG
jgi:hypothetical protein